MTERIVEPEWLDELPADEPSAIASRGDLCKLNGLMNHARIIAQALHSFATPRRVLDLGAGDGTLTLRVARSANWNGVEIILLDRAGSISPSVHQAFIQLNCHATVVRQDVFEGLDKTSDADLIMANLFLHHFDRRELTRLLNQAATRCTVFVACEPRRSSFAWLASRLVGLIGCNAVTRHDAVASVRAGFRGREISEHWPGNSGWSLAEKKTGLFSHLFMAHKT